MSAGRAHGSASRDPRVHDETVKNSHDHLLLTADGALHVPQSVFQDTRKTGNSYIGGQYVRARRKPRRPNKRIEEAAARSSRLAYGMQPRTRRRPPMASMHRFHLASKSRRSIAVACVILVMAAIALVIAWPTVLRHVVISELETLTHRKAPVAGLG